MFNFLVSTMGNCTEIRYLLKGKGVRQYKTILRRFLNFNETIKYCLDTQKNHLIQMNLMNKNCIYCNKYTIYILDEDSSRCTSLYL